MADDMKKLAAWGKICAQLQMLDYAMVNCGGGDMEKELRSRLCVMVTRDELRDALSISPGLYPREIEPSPSMNEITILGWPTRVVESLDYWKNGEELAP